MLANCVGNMLMSAVRSVYALSLPELNGERDRVEESCLQLVNHILYKEMKEGGIS